MCSYEGADPSVKEKMEIERIWGVRDEGLVSILGFDPFASGASLSGRKHRAGLLDPAFMCLRLFG
jgi:hypothetical protein